MDRTHAQARQPASHPRRATSPPVAAGQRVTPVQVHEVLHSPRLQRSPAPPAGTAAAPAPSPGKDYFTELLEEIRLSRLKGTEWAGLQTLVSAAMLGLTGIGGERFGEGVQNLSVFNKYVREATSLSPSETTYVDPLSLLFRASVSEWVSSPRFRTRLGQEKASLVGLAILGQALYSSGLFALDALFPPKPGRLAAPAWAGHLQFPLSVGPLFVREQLKPPDAFPESRIALLTNPLLVPDFLGGPMPSGLTFERLEGVGEPGSRTRFGLTLNLAKLIRPKGLSAKAVGDLARHRGWQATVSGSVDALDPTPTSRAQGQREETKFKVGGMVGTGGVMLLAEGGGSSSPGAATGEDEKRVTFVKGGASFTLPKVAGNDSGPSRFGVTTTFFRFIREAPAEGEDGDVASGPGHTLRLTPFFDVGLATGRHRVAFGASLSLLTGQGPSNVSEVRGHFSYRYLGEGPDGRSLFLFEVAGSRHHFLPWEMRSAAIDSIQIRAILGNVYGGLKLMSGTEGIPGALLDAIDPATRSMTGTSWILSGGLVAPF